MEGFVTSLRENFLGWLFPLMWVDTMGLPLPSEIPLLYAGFLASRGELNIVAATVLAALGATCGSALAYVVSRRYGRAAVLRWGRRFLITEEHLHGAERWFARRGEAAVFVCRMVPLARTLISIPAGIAQMSVPRFLVFTFAGTLPWAAGLMALGWALGDGWRKVLGSFTLASIAVGAVIVGFVVWWIARRRRAALREAPRQ